MLRFTPITLENKALIDSYLRGANSYFCDHCFIDIFIWKDQFKTQYCIKEEFLFLKTESFPDGTTIYLAPIGQGSFFKSISYIQQDAKERGIPFTITCLSKKQIILLEQNFSGQFQIEELRDSADYIYHSHDLIHLKGSKYHSKRNFINRFQKIYEKRWKYEGITLDNYEEVLAFYHKWCLKNADKSQGLLKGEKQAVQLALDHFDQLGMRGGLLRLDGKVVAFTLGTQHTDDMFIIQVEKADSDIPGAYQMINHLFAIVNCQKVLWINREEDLGIEGLRKAKLSYHPACLEMKYRATEKAKIRTGDEQGHVYSFCKW